MDILTIGEVFDRPDPDRQGCARHSAVCRKPRRCPGKSGVAASRLGAQTAFIGKVGADAFGRYLKEVLAENKVDVSAWRWMQTTHHHGGGLGRCHRRAGFQLLPQRQR